MSDSQDKSDDLIAELAKLMASNAQGSESEPKPTVIKLAPLDEAAGEQPKPAPTPPPIRIPGMEMPAAPAARPAATPTIRIPGMEKPAGIDLPPAADDLPPAPRPQAAAAPEPASMPAKPVPQPPLTQLPPLSPAPRVDPAPATLPTPTAPQPAAAADSFDFDFGFGSSSGSAGKGEGAAAEQAQAKPQEPAAPPPAATPPVAGHDPIADLIAAELDAAQAVPATPEPPKAGASPAAPAQAFPSSVEVVPARNFGSTAAGQAPVLVARPAAAAAPQPAPAPASFRPLQPESPKAPESDRFAVAPVFGLGGRPSSSAPSSSAPSSAPAPQPAPVAPPRQPFGEETRAASAAAEPPRHVPDPMDEIESLIGEAVRVELSGTENAAARQPQAQPQPQVQPQPQASAPAVPPLATAFAPRRAGLKDTEPQVRSAEAAILAAAAATGAEVGRIGSATAEDRAYRRPKASAPRGNMLGGMRQYVGLAVAGTLLLAAGFGLYWVIGMGRGDAEAPVLTADATPAKQPPAAAPASTAEPARSVVFDEIDGVSAVDNAETLVSRDETADASAAEVARVVVPEGAATTESGLANRKVRTVTVRPDGTIVSGDEAVAGTEALPVDRPNVPAVPGASVEPSDLLTAVVGEDPAASAEADPIAAAIAEGQRATNEATPVGLTALAPTSATTTQAAPAVFDASLVAPVPMPRPVDRSALNGGSRAASLDDLPLVDLDEPGQAAPAGTAAAYVQLSSQRSEAEAQASLRSVQSRFGSLFGVNRLEVQRADLGAKGIYYRVRLPASSLQEATQICASIKSNGGDCFATSG